MTRRHTFAILLLLTAAAITIQGYHPGLEDDAYYLAAIKQDLNPTLYPHDADFFRLQFQATIFDKLIAASIRLTHLPISAAILLWHFAATLAILAACLAIARRCFPKSEAHWSAVATVAALLTIPVSGTGISLTDQYLHPRALATAAIMGAIVAILDNRHAKAALFLIAAAAMHVIMAAYGASLCLFLYWNSRHGGCPTQAWFWLEWGLSSASRNPRPPTCRSQLTAHSHLSNLSSALAISPLTSHLSPLTSRATLWLALALPLHWLFQPTTQAWRDAAATRHFNLLTHWPWYEWLGVIAPFAILYYFARQARTEGANQAPESQARAHLAIGLIYYSAFQLAVALIILLPPQLERLRPFEPMRYLHLVYLLMFLIAGGIIGQHILGRHTYRWLLFFLPLSAGMFYAQRQMYPATAHLELPGRAPANDYLRAFAWIKQKENTPTDALFALDPYYMQQPGEDFHGFRALAERSSLADMVKDPGMVARVPTLAERWQKEVQASKNWQNFTAKDFENLKTNFGVTWVVLAHAVTAEPLTPLVCPYENRTVAVCRVE
ncbi:MAG TPA: hypothetical protein VMI10_11535 [Terriglobales bacterium]|nr:hypothetical protein [Terriglobales bacterium]